MTKSMWDCNGKLEFDYEVILDIVAYEVSAPKCLYVSRVSTLQTNKKKSVIKVVSKI